MKIRGWLVVAVMVLSGALACAVEPETCAAAACDGATEMCVFYGSDTLEPSVARCEPVVDACSEDRTCTCLETEVDEDSSYRFCLDAGSCTEQDGVVELVCPGG